ncbi:tRNA (adenosine(37)-N6)-dimethylallyltransferase MiaA [Ignatzschineria sp. RMDPL8A]|uniref:tRNA (adenosine(37)-N6)-dimethylallyltransferase MiaA n=1 Tax=Ignatzschineria sp. RMDPL8A TaxID=2999236 RepID=UPI002A68804C|nr:tRNA (adenosine(37)-N6)-dimethylallyltransferase MiaA [Ignatzschineria sp. RMDPL8A]
MHKKVICLMGPTASGKTSTALFLADHLPLHIISVDSALIYKGMDIGTAKPDKTTLERYPHALVDIINPLERYSAAQFRLDATREIEYAFSEGKIPLLVGGTFLYFQALLEGISPIPQTPDAILNELQQTLDTHGSDYLHQELEKVDPESAKRLNPNDSQRIMRALSVYRASGQTLTHFWSLPKKEALPYPALKLALSNSDVTWRNALIAERYKEMIEMGLVTEVETLMKTYPELNLDYPSMRAVGYRQIYEHLLGDHTLDEAVELAIIATRQYAKRQRTWLRREENLTTIEVANNDYKGETLAKVTAFLEEDV